MRSFTLTRCVFARGGVELLAERHGGRHVDIQREVVVRLGLLRLRHAARDSLSHFAERCDFPARDGCRLALAVAGPPGQLARPRAGAERGVGCGAGAMAASLPPQPWRSRHRGRRMRPSGPLPATARGRRCRLWLAMRRATGEIRTRAVLGLRALAAG